jgi:hypothetical protein
MCEIKMKEIIEKLTDYTLALKDGLERTKEANERPLLTGRLAAAAEMFALLHKKGDVLAIQDLVQSQVRAHGWSFIAGLSEEQLANKWVAFTKAVGVTQ